MNNNKITGIIVCVDFSVFLKETLPFSKPLLDNLYIITADDDIKTKKLCEKTDTKYLSMPRTTPIFLKGVYTNYAFDHIPHEGWFLITDADIVLPSKKEFNLSQIKEKSECLYGTYCQYCRDYEEWIDYRDNRTQYNWKIWEHNQSIGMGYLQIFHTNHFQNRNNCRYPDCTIVKIRNKIKGCDYIFARRFKCRKQKLPFNVLHLSDNKNIKNDTNKNRNRQYKDITKLSFGNNQ